MSSRTCQGYAYVSKENCESAPDNHGKNCVSVSDDGETRWCAANEAKINTPGSTIGAAVAAGVTSDITWGANIESWVSALVNAAINRLIKEGISELNNSDNPEYSGVLIILRNTLP